MECVKIALIGAGGMANGVHYPSLAECDDVDLVGLCDLVQEKAEATAARFHIPRTFTDYRVMLEQTAPDAVYVLMPSYHHFDILVHCLSQGLHVFIEKPIALDRAGSESVLRAQQDSRRLFSSNLILRTEPRFIEVKRLVENGELGEIVAIEGDYLHDILEGLIRAGLAR